MASCNIILDLSPLAKTSSTVMCGFSTEEQLTLTQVLALIANSCVVATTMPTGCPAYKVLLLQNTLKRVLKKNTNNYFLILNINYTTVIII